MNFSFIHFTDHHISDSEESLAHGFSSANTLRAVIRHIAQNVAEQADFILTTGDLVDCASELAYKTLSGILGLHGETASPPGPLLITSEGLQDYPLYVLPGNHDDRDSFFRVVFPSCSSSHLVNCSFEHKNIQFICLDWGVHPKAVTHHETLEFLARSLQTDLLSIIVMHHHIVPIGSRWLDDLLADDTSQFWNIVMGHNVIGVICGHVHMTYERIINNIPILGVRSTAFQFVLQDEPSRCLLPPHYRLITIHNGEITSKIFEVPLYWSLD